MHREINFAVAYKLLPRPNCLDLMHSDRGFFTRVKFVVDTRRVRWLLCEVGAIRAHDATEQGGSINRGKVKRVRCTF